VGASNNIGEERIGKLLLSFSIPAIIGMVVNALYNVIDRLFVGKGVGPLGQAATTVAFPIPIVMFAFAMLIGIGAAASVSIKLGQKNQAEAEHILGNAFVLIILTSVSITILGLIFLDPMLVLFGASEEVMPLARDFVSILLAGTLLQNLGFGMNHIIRASGDPKTSMYTMLIGALVNIMLNPLFIFVFKLGIKGSALATIISQAVSTIWVMSYFLGGRSLLKIRKVNFKLNIGIVNQIFSIGMSPFLMQIAAAGVTIILNFRLKTYGGDDALAAMGIVNSIANFILMPVFGINQGAQPIIGFNYGAKKYDRVIKTLKLAIIAGTCISTFGFLVTQLFPRAIISQFSGNDEQLLDLGVLFLRFMLFMLPIIGFQIVSANYFQAIGKAKISIFLALSRQVLVLIPVLLILPNFFGLLGVAAAGPTADFIASLLTLYMLAAEMKHMKELKAAEVAIQ